LLAWTDRIALYLVAGFVVVLVLSGVAAVFSDGARRLLLRRLGGSIYRAIAEESRAAERTATAKQETANELQQEIQALGTALSMGMSSVEIAATHVRVLCPDTRQALDALLAAARQGNRTRADLDKLLDAVRDAAADCLRL
jgi:hydroxypyruvate isomerase